MFVLHLEVRASVKKVVTRTCTIVTILVVLIGVVTGGFVYGMVQDARQAAEAVRREQSGPVRSTKTWQQNSQEEKGLKWIQRGDNAAADQKTEIAILDYRLGLEYFEDSDGCQSAVAKSIREKIANLQRKPYDVPCTAGRDNRLPQTN
jgi:hypothetical protein